jgi:hypothetical protein
MHTGSGAAEESRSHEIAELTRVVTGSLCPVVLQNMDLLTEHGSANDSHHAVIAGEL